MLLFCIFVRMVNYSLKKTSENTRLIRVFVLFMGLLFACSSVFSNENRKQLKSERGFVFAQMSGWELKGILEPVISIEGANSVQRVSFGIKNSMAGSQWAGSMKNSTLCFNKYFNLPYLVFSTPLYITNRVIRV